MRRRTGTRKEPAEENIPIVLEGLRGEESITPLCRREGTAECLYYNWSKEFLEAGKKDQPLINMTTRTAQNTISQTLRILVTSGRFSGFIQREPSSIIGTPRSAPVRILRS